MFIKIAIPKHFQLRLISGFWNMLLLKKGDIVLLWRQGRKINTSRCWTGKRQGMPGMC